MNHNMTKKVVAYALGGISGAIVGYFAGELIAYKIAQKENEEALQEAIDEVVSGYKPEAEEETGKPETKNGNAPKIDYTKYAVKSNPEKPSLAELASSIDHTQPAKKASIYIISVDAYSEQPNYTKEPITYYESDATYSDSNEMIISDPERVLGANLHLHFGEESEDPDVVYVRNEDTQTDYEVIRIHKSYKTEVLGEPEEPKKPSRGGRKGKAVKNDDPGEEE
jgi:hypothetical protein